MTQRTRRQYAISTAQSSELNHYTPGKTRNLDRQKMYEGRSGIVIPFQLKVGAVAMADTFGYVVDHSYSDDIEQLAGHYATVSFNSSYHSFAQRPQHSVHRRHGALPDMMDRDTGARLGTEGLLERAQAGLATAAELAARLEDLIWNEAPQSRINTANYGIGKTMLGNALNLAAVKHRVGQQSGSEFELQQAAWEAAESAAHTSIETSALLGVRPTVAQLIDPSSPWMRYLHDNPDVISQSNYDIQNDFIRARAAEFVRSTE